MTNWKKLFREFYDDNECGGSSRWLVAPNIVEMFIDFQLQESLERVRLGERDLGQIVRDTEGVYVPTAGEIEAEWGYNQAVSDSDKKIDTELKRLKGLGGKE